MTQFDIPFQTRLKKKQYFTAASMLIADSELLEQTMSDFFTSDWRMNQKIANTLQYVKKRKKGSIVKPYYKKWINLLQSPPHDAFERNSYRYFENVEIPERLQGQLYELAFNTMMRAEKAIAIRVFAMSTCVNIAGNYSELIPELKQAIELVQNESESAGIQARARNLLKQMKLR